MIAQRKSDNDVGGEFNLTSLRDETSAAASLLFITAEQLLKHPRICIHPLYQHLNSLSNTS
jgi:hypothetical protein